MIEPFLVEVIRSEAGPFRRTASAGNRPRWGPAQQRRHLRTGLRNAENVIDEQQHVLVLLVAEILRHGKRGQRHADTGTGRLVHLAVHQRDLRPDRSPCSMTPASDISL